MFDSSFTFRSVLARHCLYFDNGLLAWFHPPLNYNQVAAIISQHDDMGDLGPCMEAKDSRYFVKFSVLKDLLTL